MFLFMCHALSNTPFRKTFSIGADCSVARDCLACGAITDFQNTAICGWCPDSQRCYSSDSNNRAYCFPGDCPQGLYRPGQCPSAATTETWSTNKTVALAVVLGICIPLIVLLIFCCVRRARKRQLAAGTTSGVGSIQARTQGYRQGVVSDGSEVSTGRASGASETSLNGVNSNAEFRQMEVRKGEGGMDGSRIAAHMSAMLVCALCPCLVCMCALSMSRMHVSCPTMCHALLCRVTILLKSALLSNSRSHPLV